MAVTMLAMVTVSAVVAVTVAAVSAVMVAGAGGDSNTTHIWSIAYHMWSSSRSLPWPRVVEACSICARLVGAHTSQL